MWISDKSITRLAKALNVEIFQLFVPYRANKRDLIVSPASALLELRQNIMGDAEQFCTHVDHRINEALKSSLHRDYEEELKPQKPVREKLRRGN